MRFRILIMNMKKVLLIIGILILFFSVPVGIFVLKQGTIFHLGAQSANGPQDVRTTAITDQSATILWTTQKPAQSLISYGLSSANLSLIQPETAPAVNHQIVLKGLLPASNYFFVIKVDQNTFDNNGQPFTFTTKTKEMPLLNPTSTLTPQPTEASVLTEQGFNAAMGTNNSTYDLNNDGIVSTLDLLLFRQQSK